MRFTNSPYEKMMQQKPCPRLRPLAKPPRAPGVRVPLLAGIGCVSCYRELCGPRLAGGDGLARELTREENGRSAPW